MEQNKDLQAEQNANIDEALNEQGPEREHASFENKEEMDETEEGEEDFDGEETEDLDESEEA